MGLQDRSRQEGAFSFDFDGECMCVLLPLGLRLGIYKGAFASTSI